MKTPSKSILESAQRLEESESAYQATGDPVWIGFLKRESSILLRRVLKFWLRVRFRR